MKHISTCRVSGLRIEPRYQRKLNLPRCLYRSGDILGGEEGNEKVVMSGTGEKTNDRIYTNGLALVEKERVMNEKQK